MLKIKITYITPLTIVLYSHAICMNQRFDIEKVCYYESQNILQHRNKSMFISELQKIVRADYSKESLCGIYIPYSICTITHNYLIANKTPAKKVISESFYQNSNERFTSFYSAITQQEGELDQVFWYSIMKQVARRILQHITPDTSPQRDIDTLCNKMQTTTFEDKMDLEK